MSIKKAYFCRSLTGEGEGALDSLDGAILNHQDAAWVPSITVNKSYLYVLDEASGAAEDPPNVIAPVTNAGTKRWILTDTSWDGDIADIDLDGATDIGAALADEDLILVDDGAGGTNRKATLSRLLTYMQDNLVISILLTLLATASSNVYTPTMIATSLTVTVS